MPRAYGDDDEVCQCDRCRVSFVRTDGFIHIGVQGVFCIGCWLDVMEEMAEEEEEEEE